MQQVDLCDHLPQPEHTIPTLPSPSSTIPGSSRDIYLTNSCRVQSEGSNSADTVYARRAAAEKQSTHDAQRQSDTHYLCTCSLAARAARPARPPTGKILPGDKLQDKGQESAWHADNRQSSVWQARTSDRS